MLSLPELFVFKDFVIRWKVWPKATGVLPHNVQNQLRAKNNQHNPATDSRQLIACAMITAMGMQAENMQRETLGQSMAYDYSAFANLIEEYGLLESSAKEAQTR